MKTCTHCARTLSYTDRHGGCPFCGLDSVVEREEPAGHAHGERGAVVHDGSGMSYRIHFNFARDAGTTRTVVGPSHHDDADADPADGECDEAAPVTHRTTEDIGSALLAAKRPCYRCDRCVVGMQCERLREAEIGECDEASPIIGYAAGWRVGVCKVCTVGSWVARVTCHIPSDPLDARPAAEPIQSTINLCPVCLAAVQLTVRGCGGDVSW